MGLVIGGGRGMTKLKNLVTSLVNSIVTAWSATPLDTNIPSEKLVHDNTVLRTATLTTTLATAYTTLGRQIAINGLAGSYLGVIFLNGSTYDIKFIGTQNNGVRSALGLAGSTTIANAFTASVTDYPKMISGTAFAALIGVSSIYNSGYYEISDSTSATYTIGSQYWLSTAGVATLIFSPSTKADISPATGATSALRALFVSRGAVYNTNTGYYELNGLTDITESQMIVIYNDTSQTVNNRDLTYAFMMKTFRTAFNSYSDKYFPKVSYADCFTNNINLEVLDGEFVSQSFQLMCRGCSNLHTAKRINCEVSTNNTSVFYLCSKLVNAEVYLLKTNFQFSQSPLLSLASLQYLVTNRANGTTRITITVHATVWAKLNDAVNYPTWNALLVDAVNNKYIDFASA